MWHSCLFTVTWRWCDVIRENLFPFFWLFYVDKEKCLWVFLRKNIALSAIENTKISWLEIKKKKKKISFPVSTVEALTSVYLIAGFPRKRNFRGKTFQFQAKVSSSIITCLTIFNRIWSFENFKLLPQTCEFSFVEINCKWTSFNLTELLKVEMD